MCKGLDIPRVIPPAYCKICPRDHCQRRSFPVVLTWYQDRALAAIDTPPTQHRTYNSALCHEVMNSLCCRIFILYSQEPRTANWSGVIVKKREVWRTVVRHLSLLIILCLVAVKMLWPWRRTLRPKQNVGGGGGGLEERAGCTWPVCSSIWSF
jgi:hypothetical protein